MRVLRPGGRLVTADVIRNMPLKGRFERMMQTNNWNFFCSKYCVPKENSDYPQDYVTKLEKANFVNVDLQSIRDEVYPKLHAYMASDPSMLRRFHLLARLPYKLALFFDDSKVYAPYDYVLVKAEKAA